ncbi:MarR family transcriptional regulator [Arthrobacter crystallopoietes BAB-32]|uniref:MarR family transcriptional regulator n=1 Tax=Arthrobacter crystallopoietes BAB-32 TaxID=1246476 RepID=N1V007_9MICC|nr:MarR family transcriptional regulator [Arthrobacter crystallopoietes]EMY33354.1 MarR family transcriptional regulator [Arthrobacter crystallopoietes BAB-32]
MERQMDAVDEIIEGWERALPKEDVEPMGVFSRISRLAQRFDALRRNVLAAHGLQLGDFDVLSAIRRCPDGALTAGQLAKENLVTSGTMTNRIDRLVARGLVGRSADVADARIVRVQLHPEGRRIVDAAFVELLRIEHELLDSIRDADRQPLVDRLRELLARIEA